MINPEFRQLTRDMIATDAVRFGNFEADDGRHTLAKVDLTGISSHQHLFELAVRALEQTVVADGHLVDLAGRNRLIVPSPDGRMDFYAGAVARGARAPLLRWWDIAVLTEQPVQLENRFQPGDEVELLDGRLSDGKDQVSLVQDLAELGLVVTGLSVLVDEQRGGRAELAKSGVEVVVAAAMTLVDIARMALDDQLGGMTRGLYDGLTAELILQRTAAS